MIAKISINAKLFFSLFLPNNIKSDINFKIQEYNM